MQWVIVLDRGGFGQVYLFVDDSRDAFLGFEVCYIFQFFVSDLGRYYEFLWIVIIQFNREDEKEGEGVEDREKGREKRKRYQVSQYKDVD